jgi:hypothetical protein
MNSRNWYRFRVVMGFVVAPLCPAILITSALTLAQPPPLVFLPRLPFVFIFVMIVSGVVTYPTTVILGIPVFLLMRKYNLNGIVAYLAAGIPMSIGPLIAPGWGPGKGWGWGPSMGFRLVKIEVFLFTLGCSLIAVATFWLIVRPDRMSRRSPLSAQPGAGIDEASRVNPPDGARGSRAGG